MVLELKHFSRVSVGRAGEESIVRHHHHIFILHMVYTLEWHIWRIHRYVQVAPPTGMLSVCYIKLLLEDYGL